MKPAASDRALAVLRDTGPLCDDCLAPAGDFLSRQSARAAGLSLVKQELAVRGTAECSRCGKRKTLTVPDGALAHQAGPDPAAIEDAVEAPERPWPWEGAVQATLAAWLRNHGYEDVREVDTAAKTPGVDIVARGPDGGELWVTVKGWLQKSQHVQARHWFAGAVLDLVRYREKGPQLDLAMALPAGFVTYGSLAKSIRWLRREMPFRIYWVGADGQVEVA
jgi:hypothetical protein